MFSKKFVFVERRKFAERMELRLMSVGRRSNRFSHKNTRLCTPSEVSSSSHHAQQKKDFFHFFLLLCITRKWNRREMCLITGIYIRRCSSCGSIIARLFSPYKAFFRLLLSLILLTKQNRIYFAAKMLWTTKLPKFQIDNHTENFRYLGFSCEWEREGDI